MLTPSQYAEKFPATSPERMLSEGPPSSEEVTISRTWRELIKVNTLTSSGIMAPARVPQEIIVASFHHSEGSPPRSGMMSLETTKVRTIEMMEVTQTSDVRGVSKFISSELP